MREITYEENVWTTRKNYKFQQKIAVQFVLEKNVGKAVISVENLRHCFSPGFRGTSGFRESLSGFPPKDTEICLVRNSRPQFYAVVAAWTHGSLHRVPWATQTFAQGSATGKKVEKHWCKAFVEPKSTQQKIYFCGGTKHRRDIYFHAFKTSDQIGHTCLGLQKLRWPWAPRSLNPSLLVTYIWLVLKFCQYIISVQYNYNVFIAKYWGNKRYCAPLCPTIGRHVPPSPLKIGTSVFFSRLYRDPKQKY